MHEGGEVMLWLDGVRGAWHPDACELALGEGDVMENDLVQMARWFFLGSLALTVIVGSISWFLKRSKRERGRNE